MSLELADVEASWAAMRPTLTLLFEESTERLYSACVSGEAVVLKAPEGFIIVSEQRNRNGTKELFVWAVAGHGGQCIRRYWPDLNEMARGLGCTSVVGRVREDRVGQLLEHSGWKIRHTEYARAVQ